MADFKLVAPEGANLDGVNLNHIVMRILPEENIPSGYFWVRSLFGMSVFKENGDLKGKYMGLRRFGHA